MCTGMVKHGRACVPVHASAECNHNATTCSQVVDLFKHFTINEFFFQNDKSRAMMAALLPEERALFNCDTTELVRAIEKWKKDMLSYTFRLVFSPALVRYGRATCVTSPTASAASC